MSRRLVITGAASGIGAGLAAAFPDDELWLLDRRTEPLERVAEHVGGHAVAVDVTDPEAVTAALAGIGRIDGVVNNAGVGNLKRLENYTDAEFDRLVQVNLYGVFYVMRAAVSGLRESAAGGGQPAVVNVGSSSGTRPTFGEGPYSAAKAAVVALTVSAAVEWAPEIRVNCVSPGFIATPLNQGVLEMADVRDDIEGATPAARVGRVDEVVDTVRWLLSPQSSYVTGQNVVIDGGAALVHAQTHALLRRFVG